MPLVELDIAVQACPLPADVTRYLDEAGRRIDQFVWRRRDNPVAGFVPSDFPLVYQTLRTIQDVRLPTGDRFCEWGCGFGVVASLAAWLGFEAYGIEVDRQLVSAARQLADDFGIDVRFVRGSFIPPGAEAYAHCFGDFHWLDTAAKSAYDQLRLDPDDFDLIFVYPWPGEEEVVTALFERYAAAGSILLTYHGCGQLQVRRKKTQRAANRDRHRSS